MFIQEAINLNVAVHILDPDPNAPCKHLATAFTEGDLKDYDTVYAFGKQVDLLTIEIEHVNVDALEQLEKEGLQVYPQPNVLRIVQDKGLQKQFYQKNHIPTAPFFLCENKAEIANYKHEFPFMQKMRKGGYDGKGVTKLTDPNQLDHAFEVPSVLEKLVDFSTEISVIVARRPSGQVNHFPVVDMVFNAEANLVEFLFSPAELEKAVEDQAYAIAAQVANALDFVGILAIEMFVTKTGDVLVNEIAPRPHNSGHHTIEANQTSQYEQHLRAILDLPLGSTDIIAPSVMVNLLGEANYTGEAKYEGLDEVLAIEGAHVHLYGKKKTKPFRKMGHITVIDQDPKKAREKATIARDTLKIIA